MATGSGSHSVLCFIMEDTGAVQNMEVADQGAKKKKRSKKHKPSSEKKDEAPPSASNYTFDDEPEKEPITSKLAAAGIPEEALDIKPDDLASPDPLNTFLYEKIQKVLHLCILLLNFFEG